MDFQNNTPGFDFDGDQLCLDFANTADWHASAHPVERLNAYSDLLTWGRLAGVLDDAQAQALYETAQAHTEQARAALHQAVRLREAIFRIFSEAAGYEAAPPGDLKTLNASLQRALPHLRLQPAGDGYEYAWEAGSRDLEQVLWPVARSAAELLTSEDLDRVGRCADDRGCGYLFYDSSRNRSRRWCSMESCGNRAKAMRFYERKTLEEEAE